MRNHPPAIIWILMLAVFLSGLAMTLAALGIFTLAALS